MLRSLNIAVFLLPCIAIALSGAESETRTSLTSKLVKTAEKCDEISDVTVLVSRRPAERNVAGSRETRARFLRAKDHRVLIFEEKNDNGKWKGELYGENPDYQFILIRNHSDEDWVIKSISQEFHPDSKVSKWLDLSVRNHFEPSISLEDKFRLSDLLADSRIEAQIVSETDTHDIEVRIKPENTAIPNSTYLVELHNGEPATISQIKVIDENDGMIFSEKFEGYGQHLVTPACPKTLERKWFVDGNVSAAESFVYEKVSTDKVNESAFYLSAFGLPEPVNSPDRDPHLKVSLIAAGCISVLGVASLALLLGLVFRSRARGKP